MNRKRKTLLGKKLKTIRQRAELTQSALAKKIGADVRQISLYENNKIVPSTQVLVRLSEALGVTLDYLVRDNAEEGFIPKINDPELLHQFEKIDQYDEDTRYVIKRVVKGLMVEKDLNSMVTTSPARK